MAVEFMETINQLISSYAGSHFFTVMAATIAIYYIVRFILGRRADTRPQPCTRAFEEESQPLPAVQLGEISEEEFKDYDVNDAAKPLLMCIKGPIYDVTQSSSLENKYNIVRSIGEECIQEEELWNLLKKKQHPICYDGFEPSGRMHIAQGVMKTINVNKLTSAGCEVKIVVADWFAKLNNKMDRDMQKIRVVGEYMIEIWKAAGMKLENVEFLWSSDEINKRAHEYWPMVMDIATKNSVGRITRCCQIMGRNEKDDLTAAQILYPLMQCADVFFLKADICQLGMDQRKVNVLAREYCDVIKRKNKPIILSHHMLPGLLKGQEKMSKSDSSSAVFMEDEETDVNSKIKKAYCPPRTVEGNPCLEYIKYIVFPWFNEFKVKRELKNGGPRVFNTYEELVAAYAKDDLHPADLKPALSDALNKILQPVRDHFETDKDANDLLKKVKGYKASK